MLYYGHSSKILPIDCPLQAIKSNEHEQSILISLLCQEKIIHVHPTLAHQSLQSLAAQGFSGFEELVGTKYQENEKCPSFWEKLGKKLKGGTITERWEMSREIIWVIRWRSLIGS